MKICPQEIGGLVADLDDGFLFSRIFRNITERGAAPDDPRKWRDRARHFRPCLPAERFAVTMTLVMNDNENAWEYPAFSTLHGNWRNERGARSSSFRPWSTWTKSFSREDKRTDDRNPLEFPKRIAGGQ